MSLLVVTRWGIGTSPDSVHYIHAARQLIEPQVATVGGGSAAVPHYAPLYPLMLAAGGFAGVDPLEWARWLNALAFGLNSLLVGFIVAHSARRTFWVAPLGAALALISFPSIGVHLVALSEPVFIGFLLLGFQLLGLYLEDARRRHLLGAAAALGLAMFTRYAGVAGIVTGGVALLLLGQAPVRRRVRDALVLCVIGVLPTLIWMTANVAAGRGATGRELVFHPVGWAHAWQALYTVSGWLLIPQASPDAVRLLACGVMAAGVPALAWSVWNRRFATPVIPIVATFIATYAVFLVVSISLFDANTPLDDRILLPSFFAGLIIAMYAIGETWPALRERRVLRRVMAALLAFFAVGHAFRSADMVSTSFAHGWGFTSLAWTQSPTLAQVRALPEGSLVYSNAPEIVYLHTGLAARPVPRRQFLMTGQLNTNLASDLAAVERDIRLHCGALVYFRTLRQKSVPTESELRDRLALTPLSQTADGVILGATACSQ